MTLARSLVVLLFLFTPSLLAQEPETPPADPPPAVEPEAPAEEDPQAPDESDPEAGVDKHEDEAKQRVEDAKQNLAQAKLAVRTATKAERETAERVKALTAELEAATKTSETAEATRDAAQEAFDAAPEGTRAKEEQALAAAEAALLSAQEAQAKAETELEQAQASLAEVQETLESANELLEELSTAGEQAAFRTVAAAAARRALEAAKAQERTSKVKASALKLQLLPLTKAALEEEAEAWRLALQADVSAISYAEIAMSSAEGEEKAQIAQALTELRDERTALIDRLEIVLKALEAKGGDAAEHRAYYNAVSGVFTNLDATDVSATWTTVVGWLKSTEGGLRILKNLLLALGTLIVFKLIASAVGGLVFRTLTSSRFKTPELLRTFFVNMARKCVFAVGIVMALSALEVNIAPFIAALGGAVLVVGLALQGTLSNFAAGILIILYRPYDVGNVVKVAGELGKVESMNLMSTTILTPDNQLVVVPNGTIWGGVITNLTGKQQRRVDMTFGVGYTDDLAKTEETLKEILTAHPQVLAEPAPVIQLHELADSSVNFVVRPWCNTADYWDVYWDVTRKVKDTFDERGISIPFPQRDVHVFGQAAAATEAASA